VPLRVEVAGDGGAPVGGVAHGVHQADDVLHAAERRPAGQVADSGAVLAVDDLVKQPAAPWR